MKAEELLTEIIRLQAEMERVIIESTDANEWKEYYDRQIKLMESYARQKAVEFFKYLRKKQHDQCEVPFYFVFPGEDYYDEFNKQ